MNASDNTFKRFSSCAPRTHSLRSFFVVPPSSYWDFTSITVSRWHFVTRNDRLVVISLYMWSTTPDLCFKFDLFFSPVFSRNSFYIPAIIFLSIARWASLGFLSACANHEVFAYNFISEITQWLHIFWLVGEFYFILISKFIWLF